MLEPSPALLPREKEGDAPPNTPGRLPPTDPQLSVLHYEPGRYIVVDKPADVRIDGEFTHTVEKLVLNYITSTGFAIESTPGFGVRFVHRLDYATSGVLLLGLSKHAAGVAATQFEKRDVRKNYLALVHGHIDLKLGGEKAVQDGFITFAEPIADTKPPGYVMVVGTLDNPGRASLTRCYPLAQGTYYGAPVTKVRLEPHTGRRHQLRVHCAHAGIPIVGDATYIENDDLYFAQKGFVPHRMMLHAHELHVSLPKSDQVLHGRKSGLRNLVPKVFVTKDPFTVDSLPGLDLEESSTSG